MKQRDAIIFAHHRLTKAGQIVKTLLERVDQLEAEREILMDALNNHSDRLAQLERQVLRQDDPVEEIEITAAPIPAEGETK